MQDYFKELRSHVSVLAEDERFASALREFADAAARIDSAAVTPEVEAGLRSFYETNFLPTLAAQSAGRPELSFFLPRSPATRLLQYQYIAKNPHPPGQRWKFSRGDASSRCAVVHERYHPQFASIVAKLGYYDLFLITPDGQVVYSTAKEADFASNLLDGPYAGTSLATVFHKARRTRERDTVSISDFNRCAPTFNQPAAFWPRPCSRTSCSLALWRCNSRLSGLTA